MSNLSDLLPAGAGGKQVSFTASGAISNGQTVILNTDGTVSVIEGADTNAGSGTSFESTRVNNTAAAYDANSGKIVVFYCDQGGAPNTRRPTGVVGTVSGTSISFGTPVQVNTDATSGAYHAVYDSTNQKVVCTYRETTGTDKVYAVVGTVSGTSISFGAKNHFTDMGDGDIRASDMTYDATSGKVVFVGKDTGSSDYGAVRLLTVSGTSISKSARIVFKSNMVNHVCVAYSPDVGKVVIGYDNNNNDVLAVVGTVSGSTMSFGSESTVTTDNGSYMRIAYDTTNDKFVIAYQFTDGYASVGTVSGTSVTWGTPVVFASGESYGTNSRAVYNTKANKVVFVWSDTGASDNAAFVEGTVNGTSISFSSTTTFGTNQSFFGAAYDSSNEKVVFSFSNSSSTGDGRVITNSYTNKTDFIGIADEAISDTASGNITIKGGVASNGLSSLTPGSTYYVQNNGSLSTTSSSVLAGKALSATSINLDYSS